MYFIQTPGIIKALSSKKLVWNIPNREKKVYITFDDGPVPEVTPGVLQILADYKLKSTFFCVGHNVSKYTEIFQMLKSEGQITGNHTFNHLNGWKTTTKEYIENVEQCNDHLNSTLFRPPYGRMKTRQIRALSKKYNIIMWSVLSGDFDHNNSRQKCVDNVLNNVKEGSIILFHDSIKAKERVLYALPAVIENLLRMGYRIEPVRL